MNSELNKNLWSTTDLFKELKTQNCTDLRAIPNLYDCTSSA